MSRILYIDDDVGHMVGHGALMTIVSARFDAISCTAFKSGREMNKKHKHKY